MKLPKKPPRRLDVARAFFDFARSKGLPISGAGAEEAFVEYVRDVVQTEAQNPIVRHGFRTEAMFAFVARGLPGCQHIAREDSGSLHGPEEAQPDYRILPVEGDEFFVEVKNHYQKKGPNEPLYMKQSYVDAQLAYASAQRRELRFAVYWTKWNLWTLVSPAAFRPSKGRLVLSLDRAILQNEMGRVLSDYMVGSPYPLALRLYTDPSKPRQVSESGQARPTLQRSVLCVNGEEIADRSERKLAAFFMFCGDWANVERPCHIEHEQVLWFEFSLGPEEPQWPPGNIEMLGTWSGMASRRYRDLTRHGDEVGQVELDGDPEELCPHVPDDYQGQVLAAEVVPRVP